MQEKPVNDNNFVTLDDKGKKALDLSIFLKALVQRCMGKAIDYGRMSGMSDRSFQQYERSVKDEFYKVIDDGTNILKEFGHIDEQK